MSVKTTKFLTVQMTVLSLLLSSVGFVPARPAEAALSQRSPLLDPASGFPLWYEDVSGGGGNRLMLCGNPADPNCLADPVIAGNAQSEAAGFGQEAFYWNAGNIMDLASGGQASLVLALEAGYVTDPPQAGAQSVFNRVRVRIDAPIAGDYTVTHPFGSKTYNVATTPGVINDTVDVPGLVAGNFDTALTDQFSPFVFGPFLTAVSPVAPAGYIGSPLVEQTVTGSPSGNNFFRVQGPAGSNLGGVGIDTVTKSTFTLSGKLFAPTIKAVTPIKVVVPTDSNQFTFSSNDTGTITVGGAGCSLNNPTPGVTDQAAASNSNTITINTVTPANSTANYNCTVSVTNASGNTSNVLAVRPFTVDTRPPFLSAINVASVVDTVKVGTTKQMAATTLDQFGNAISAAVVWESSNTAVGTVDASGVFSAIGTGSTTITARNAAGTVLGTTVVNANTLVITDIRVVSKTKTSVTLAWETSVPSTDFVKSAKKKVGSRLIGARTTSDGVDTTTHSVTIKRLKKNTRYFFQITSTDGVTTVKSPIKTFRTKR